MNNLQQGLLTYIGYFSKGEKRHFSYQTCAKTLSDLGISCHISTLRKEFSILKKEGLIEFRTYYRKPYPVLSQSGRLAIKTRLPYKKYDPWDQKWRLVVFSIPERERNFRYTLRKKLEELGFAALDDSVYLSPHPLLGTISRVTSTWGIRQFVKLMEVCRLENEHKIAKEVWPIAKINQEYQDFIDQANQAQKDKYWIFRAKDLEHQFAEIYTRDPHLPAEFLPEKWAGTDAYQKFRQIANSY